MPLPFFSIIIPALNEEHFLPHLLTDLQAQSYGNFEAIVVDGDSDDQTPTLVNRLHRKDKRFLLKRSKIRNVATQRNLGARFALAKLLIFFDADTRIDSNFLKQLQLNLRDQPCDAWTMYAKPDTNKLSDAVFMSCQNLIFALLSNTNTAFSLGACLGCTQKAFKITNGFNPQTNFMEDSEFVQKIVKNQMQFRVFSTPTFVFSMRRYEKDGKVELIAKLLPHQLRILFKDQYVIDKSVYPMHGGGYYKRERMEKDL